MTDVGRKLPRAFYARDTLEVAADLIGMHLVHAAPRGLRIARIVETEAYQGPEDLAAHSARGRRTARTEGMFGAPGHAYVYLIYGFWNCLNVVTREAGVPHAVLLRAAEPVRGFRGKSWGPGLLAKALQIDRRLDGADLCGARLWIARPVHWSADRSHLRRGARIGVDYAGQWARRPWRFFDGGSPYISTLSEATRARGLRQRGGWRPPEVGGPRSHAVAPRRG
jgi:DNA-3-methyladenine glycosylase